MKKLVIFDFDGTLVNSLGGLRCSVNHCLEQLGFPIHSSERIKSFIGGGVLNLLQKSLPVQHRNPETLGRLRDLFFEYYDQHNADECYVYDGITELIHKLQSQGILVAVASNKYDKATKDMAKDFFPDIEFFEVFGQRKGVELKPAPDVIYEIMTLANINDKKAVLYVGDSDVDIFASENAGVDSCSVSWGFNSRCELMAHRPTFMADQASQIYEICTKSI